MLTFKKRIPTSDLKGPLDFVDEYNQDPDKALKKYDKFSKKIEQMQQPQVQQPPRRGGFQPFQPSVFDEPSYDWEQMDIHPMDKQTIGYSDSSWQVTCAFYSLLLFNFFAVQLQTILIAGAKCYKRRIKFAFNMIALYSKEKT